MRQRTELLRVSSAATAMIALSVFALIFGAANVGAVPPPAGAASATAPPSSTSWKVKEERWYELSLAGTPCGFNSEVVEERAGEVRTTTKTEMRMGRLGQAVVIRTQSSFVETTDGHPKEADVSKATGAAPVTTHWAFVDREGKKSVEVTDRQEGGRSNKHTEPWPAGEWLTPSQAREFVRRRLASDAAQLDYATLGPESGLAPMHVSSRRTGTGTANVNGRDLSVTKWETRTSMLDKPSLEEVSADGVLVKSSTDVGVGLLVARLSTREKATADKGSAEVMARTFVALKEDGRGLLRARTAQLRARAAGGMLGDLPSAGAQRATRVSPAEMLLDISMTEAQPIAAGDDSDAKYTRATVMIDSDDPRIKGLTDAALKGIPDDKLARADALRSAVSRHMTRKNLKSGFATASQAAESRAGDCTEHAVLLAACLRHAGIPARVATGLVYVEALEGARNLYGWHMWTQALVDGTWIDVDAVLPAKDPRSHAGHLLVATSAAEGTSLDTDLARIVDLIGDLQIEIVSIDGVPARAAAKDGAP